MILEWIGANRPGVITEAEGEITIAHANGEVSSLWLRERNTEVPRALSSLADVYERFDGIDLFSSAFKIASISQPRMSGSVKVVSNLEQMADFASQAGCTFPDGCTVFMHQAGTWFYALQHVTSTILEWDAELEIASGSYRNVIEILDQWQAAVGS